MAELLFSMPSLGADMERGRVGAWRVKAGDTITRGQVIVEVDTDKGLIDVECFHDAIVAELLVPEGHEVDVGTPIARLLVNDAASSSSSTIGPTHAATITPPTSASSLMKTPTPATTTTTAPSTMTPARPDGERIVATPLAKRRAREQGIDLARIAPGPSGRITADDVDRALAERARPSDAHAPTAPAPQDTAPPSDATATMRRAIAAAVSKSKREIPHYYLWHDVDVTDTMAWLLAHNAAHSLSERIVWPAVVAVAVAQTAARFSECNGRFENDRFTPSATVHLGIATSLRGGGLIAPAILEAERLDVASMMKALTDLVLRVRGGGLRGSEMTSGTITLSSLGDIAIDGILPVIQPPQVAIVGVGRVAERAVVHQGHIVARSMATISLAADHRVSDGARGARFLLALEKALQTPASLAVAPTPPTPATMTTTTTRLASTPQKSRAVR